MYKICPECDGKKVFGYRNYPCKTCNAWGVVEDESVKIESTNGQQNAGKQNEIQNTKKRGRKKTVDSSAQNSDQGVGQILGEKPTVGVGEPHLSERKESGESCEKLGLAESEEKQRCEQIPE